MDPMMASIQLFAGNFAPRGWAFCDGQLLSIAQNTALFSLLGTTYGGDGRTTFGLPDLRGRGPIGPRNGPGLSDYRLGQRGGVETVTLTEAQMPSHTHAHSFSVNNGNSTEGTPTAGASIAVSGTNDGRTFTPTLGFNAETPNVALNPSTVTVANNGGSQYHTNIQPFLAINYIIALQGIFPSRN